MDTERIIIMLVVVVVVVVANISVLCWSAQLVHINIEHLLVTAVPVMDQHDQNKDSAERSR